MPASSDEQYAEAARPRLILDFVPTMSGCISPIIHGGWTCWNGVRPRRTRCRSTSTGTYCPIERAARAAADHRSSYGQALEKGEIELRYDGDEGSFSAWYFEHRLPIAPERYSEILRTVVRTPAPKVTRRENAFSSLRRAIGVCVIQTAVKRPRQRS